MKNKLITGVITGIVLLAFAGGASAVMTAEDLQAKKDARDEKKAEIEATRAAKKEEIEIKKEEKQAEIEAKKEEIKEKRCEQVKSRVQKKIEKFEGNNKYHQKNFNGVQKNLEELLNLFKEEGLDTSDLESYLAVLETKLQKLYADHQAFVDALNASTEVDCTNIEEGVKNKLQIAKQEGEIIREDILDIKDYYKNTIRPELIKLKNEYLEITGEDLEDLEDEAEEESEELKEKVENDNE